MSKEIIVRKEYDGVKPKNFLKKHIDAPFNKIAKLLKDKRITLNGKKIKKEDVLYEGDVIKVWIDGVNLREKSNKKREQKDLGLDVLYENEDFVVFNKLPGIVVQGAQDHDTSLSLHLEFYKQKLGDNSSFDYFHVHRLDKETSGVLVVAKNMIALRELNRIFKEKRIKKKYLCLCVGCFEEKSGKIEVLMRRNAQGVREKMGIVEKGEKSFEGGIKRSVSYYEVLEEFEYKGEEFSLVEVEIKTGVMHQIRVHMKYLGHLIVCDKMYGNSFVNSEFSGLLDRQFLHAFSLEFEYKGEKVKIEAPLTKDLEKVLGVLRNG
jgi:RluA family pseudouridine synthase